MGSVPRSGGQWPITLVGTGRCGSTLLHRLLARHGELGWLLPLNEVQPSRQSHLSQQEGELVIEFLRRCES